MKTIWVLSIHTESSERYTFLFSTKPTEEEIQEFMKQNLGDDYGDDGSRCYWSLSLEEVHNPR